MISKNVPRISATISLTSFILMHPSSSVILNPKIATPIVRKFLDCARLLAY